MSQPYVIALTGQRPNKLYGYRLNSPEYRAIEDRLFAGIERALNQHETLELRSGMAQGADTLWAQAILRAKQKYPGRITFAAYVPDPEQDAPWPPVAKERYRSLLNQADTIHISSTTYSKQSLLLRNEHMLTGANLVVVLMKSQATFGPGGTYHAYRYAQRQGIETFIIEADTLNR